MTDIQHCVIVVPARNEEDLLVRCLSAIALAKRESGHHFAASAPDVTTIVVADGCDDATATVARAFQNVFVIETAARGVGAARAKGVEMGMRIADGHPSTSWIANTDADSAVHPSWLIEQVESARRGADLYIGDVRPDFDDLTISQREAWLKTHTWGIPRGHVHGANLGIRASTYSDIGGFGSQRTGEDVDLVGRAKEAGARVSLSSTEVLTSGRGRGRAQHGYAHYLSVDLLSSGVCADAEESESEQREGAAR